MAASFGRRSYLFYKTLEQILGAKLQGAHVLCLEPLLALGNLELDPLAFLQAAEAVGLDRRVMNENVFTVIPADETKTFGIVKPLHCSLFHCVALFSFC